MSGKHVTYNSALNWVNKNSSAEIKMLYKEGLFKIVKTSLLAIGFHLGQLGKEALKELNRIKNEKGILLAFGENAFMLDMINMSSYRLGTITRPLTANFMGGQIGDSFIQWVPAGLKTTISYPTPIQTAVEFSSALKGLEYQTAIKKFGSEEKLLNYLKEDADAAERPLIRSLKNILKNKNKNLNDVIEHQPINGVYDDGMPWTGALLKIINNGPVEFSTIVSGKLARPVTDLIKEYELKFKNKVSFAWNGGYILNPELVGKLGLPAIYIGSPLGYMSREGVVQSPPLYNKAAFLIDQENRIKIERVNLNSGLEATFPNGDTINFLPNQRNKIRGDLPIFYDLLFDKDTIPAKNRIIYRLAGDKVIEIIENSPAQVKIIPVGLTLSFPLGQRISEVKIGDQVKFSIPGLKNIYHGIEAGPMLLKNGQIAIDMEKEGWKTPFSIATQAARLDYIDMRGPKIGAAIDDNNTLIIIAINGRIRESVGATHYDLAEILQQYGGKDGIGFDPGGSVTLIYEGEQLNISPYNPDYENNLYSLPPVPRTVGNAIIGRVK